MGDVVNNITVKAYTLARQSNDDDIYAVHDTLTEADPQSSEYYPYNKVDEVSYPSMTQGPWMLTEDGDIYQQRDELGFTHPNLHRRLDPKIPDEGDEVVPRDYSVSIMDVNSFRTTSKNTHVDYQFLDEYKEKYPQYSEEIDRRAKESEAREIP